MVGYTVVCMHDNNEHVHKERGTMRDKSNKTESKRKSQENIKGRTKTNRKETEKGTENRRSNACMVGKQGTLLASSGRTSNVRRDPPVIGAQTLASEPSRGKQGEQTHGRDRNTQGSKQKQRNKIEEHSGQNQSN